MRRIDIRTTPRLAAALVLAATSPVAPGSPIAPSPVHGQAAFARRFAEDIGLTGSPVWALAQDSTGFLWVGTEGGLVRFDGREFRSWAPDVIRVAVIAVEVSPSGEVVALDARGNLFRVEGDGARALAAPPGAPHRSLRPLAFDSEGHLWMVRGGRLVRREPNGDWILLAADAFAGERPRLIRSAGSTSVAVATESGVWRVSGASAERLLEGGPTVDLLWLGGARLAALQGREIVVLGGEDAPHVSRPLAGPRGRELTSARPIALAERNGAYWIAFDRFLVESRADESARVWGPADGLDAGGPMLVDREGSLWMGTFTALVQFPEPDTRIWTDRQGLPSTHTRFVGRAGDVLWVITWQGASFIPIADPGPDTAVRANWFAQSRPCPDRGGGLWMATDPGLILVRGTEAVQRQRDLGHLFGCAAAQTGGMWMATASGLWRTTPEGGPARVRLPVELSGGPVEAVLEDRHGRLWAATDGIVCVRGERSSAWSCERPGDTGKFADLIELENGALWAATERMGVLRKSAGPWMPLPAAESLPTRAVFGLRHARAGGVWVFGHGFVKRVLANETATGGWRVEESLGAWHGLPSLGVGDLLEDAAGTLWLATSLGIVQVPRSARSARAAPPSVALVEARSGDEHIPAASSVVLDPDDNRLELSFAALSFRDPSLLRYQIRLSPAGPWRHSAGPPSFSWPDLRPGRYRAELRASLDGSSWSSAPASFAFRVRPPWYLEWWAVAALAALGLAALWLAHRVRTGFLLGLERQRTRIAMDLHDQVGSGLGSVGILADVVGRKELEPGTRRDIARRIAETAEDLGTSLSDIIWSLDPRAGTLEELAGRLAEHGRRLFAEDSVEFTVRFPTRWPAGDLPLQLRRNVLLIGLEALYNAARHARARRVRLAFRRRGTAWLLVVRDDGVGLAGCPDRNGVADPLSESRPRDRHGLESMRSRAEEIGAVLRLRSTPGQGTTVAVWLPAGTRPPARGDRPFKRRRRPRRAGARHR